MATVALPGRQALEREVGAVLPLLRDYNLLGRDPTYLLEPLQRLSATFLGPVSREIGAARPLVVAPDGILHLLPFEVLFREDPAPGRRAAAGWRSLLRGGRRGERPLSGRHRARPRAPAARGREMDEIRRLFPADAVRVLSGAGATLSALEEAGESGGPHRLVHIVAHGVLNERRPRFSGLLLAAEPDRAGAGFLTLGTLFGLDLRCDQVVLSACSTALGERMTGEGMVGLTRGLLYAGARSVVASLWRAAGEATSRLMVDFYGRIRSGAGGGRTNALARARRAVIEGAGAAAAAGSLAGRPDYARPYFWAPFVMLGDGS